MTAPTSLGVGEVNQNGKHSKEYLNQFTFTKNSKQEVTSYLSTQIDCMERVAEKETYSREKIKQLTQLLINEFPLMEVNLQEATSYDNKYIKLPLKGILKLALTNEHRLDIFIQNTEIAYSIVKARNNKEKKLFREQYLFSYETIEQLYTEILEINEKAQIVILF